MWSFYFTTVILGLSLAANASTCPKEEDIYPCYCYELSGRIGNDRTIACQNHKGKVDVETLQQVISRLSDLKDIRLRLHGYNITLPTKLFSGIDITSLTLTSCDLHGLEGDNHPWFLGLENTLQRLDIENSVTAEHKLNIGQLDKLKYLSIRSNVIPELKDDFFSDGLSDLEELKITGNNIKKMGSNVFSHLNNLKFLSLENERFGPIRRSMLPTTPTRLTTLRFFNIGLTDLPEDIFSGMPSLKSVILRRNHITTLDEGTWSPVWEQLTSVFLYDNEIICDERLNWILKSKVRPDGVCSSPDKWKGKSLRQFLKSRKQ